MDIYLTTKVIIFYNSSARRAEELQNTDKW